MTTKITEQNISNLANIGIQWQSKITSDGSTVTTLSAGKGYFVDNSSAAGLVKLPASASAGDTIVIKDYAGNFATNKLTIQRNSHKIQGAANNSEIGTNRASITLVYIDATKGWLYTNESNVGNLELPTFISATGGTVSNSGNDRIHTFTGDGNFVVASLSNTSANNKVGYLVVAGGGGGGRGCSAGGGGAGGFREGRCGPITPYTDSPLSTSGLTATVATFPITVGGGGAGLAASGDPASGNQGSNSVFSTITSAGGGFGAGSQPTGNGAAGGSGGGGAHHQGSAGNGNTPPVSPPQGNRGEPSQPVTGPAPSDAGGGGGGATAVAADSCTSHAGGAGATTHITGSPVTYAGGGGGSNRCGGSDPDTAGGSGGGGRGGHGPRSGSTPASQVAGQDGTANTGGGGGGGSRRYNPGPNEKGAGGAGGKGIVVIRYKIQ